MIDLRPGPEVGDDSRSETFDGLAAVGDELLFVYRTDSLTGSELWILDDASGDLRLVRDLSPGAEDTFILPLVQPLGVLPGGLLFSTGSELWWSGGSTDDTRLLARSTLSIARAVFDENHAYFFSCPLLRASGAVGCSLWQTDGTRESTSPLLPSSFWPAGSSLQSLALDPTSGDIAAVVDGPSGTQGWIVDPSTRAVTPQPRIEGLEVDQVVAAPSGGFFFTRSALDDDTESLWFTDGSTERILFDEGRLTLPERGVPASSFLFFAESEPSFAGPGDCRLLASDGTVAGTRLVLDLGVGSQGCGNDAVWVEGRLFFTHAPASTGGEVWASDGTTSGTIPFDLVPGAAGSAPEEIFPTADGLVFRSRELESAYFVPAAGASATLLRSNVSRLQGATSFEGALWIAGWDGDADLSFLSRSDPPGSLARSFLTLGATPASSSPRELGRRRDDAVFLADLEPQRQPFPHSTDGTAAGTVSLAAEAPANLGRFPVRPGLIAWSDGALWFAGTEWDREPFSLLGASAEGETPIPELYGLGLDAVRIPGGVVFAANELDLFGSELFQTDGNLEGTGIFVDLLPLTSGPGREPCSSRPVSPTRFGDRLGVVWSRPLDVFCSSGQEAVSTVAIDGTDRRDLEAFPPTDPELGGFLTGIAGAGERLFLGWTFENLTDLYSVSGAGGRLEMAWRPPAPPDRESRSLRDMVEFRGRLAYRLSFTDPGPSGFGSRVATEELWLTDGSEEGSTLLLRLEDELESFESWQLATVGDRLFFVPPTAELGSELWWSDSLAASAAPVADLAEGPESSFPKGLREVDGQLLLSAATAAAGAELWRVAADSLDLEPLAEIDPGPRSGAPSEPIALGSDVLLAGTREDVGRELFSFDRTVLEPACATDSVAGSVCLGDDRFRVSVDWLDRTSGDSGRAVGSSLTRDTASFWFFDEDNVELLVKVLDGRAINDHFWVYAGAVTDVAYWVTVFDTLTGETTTYENRQGTQCGLGDVGALPEDAEAAALFGRLEPLPPAEAPAAGPDDASETCEPSATRLCLQEGRFAVDVEWKTEAPNAGSGLAVPATVDSGYFWFFSRENLELVVKVLDGRAINGRYWVYSGALSDVEYELVVTDTVSGESRTYRNDAGSQCGAGDVEAFRP